MLYHIIIITILLSSQGKHERCHLKGQLPGGFYFFSRPAAMTSLEQLSGKKTKNFITGIFIYILNSLC